MHTLINIALHVLGAACDLIGRFLPLVVLLLLAAALVRLLAG